MDYISTSRSNYFRVKDAKAFEAWCSKIGLDVWTKKIEGQPGTFHAVSSDQSWPSDYLDEETDDLIELDFNREFARHLVDTDIAVFLEAGAEGQRYVVGHAFAVHSDGASVGINLDEVYDKGEKAFGIDKCITEAVR